MNQNLLIHTFQIANLLVNFVCFWGLLAQLVELYPVKDFVKLSFDLGNKARARRDL